MVRSIFAIIIAVVAGVFAARFVEIVGGAVFSSGAANGAITGGHQALLVAGWAFGGFLAAALALLVGRRWAPLGWLGAATILLLAVISIAGQAVAWPVWIGAFIAPGLGGWGAVRVLRADYAHPARRGDSAG